jgi:hypothetical protein
LSQFLPPPPGLMPAGNSKKGEELPEEFRKNLTSAWPATRWMDGGFPRSGPNFVAALSQWKRHGERFSWDKWSLRKSEIHQHLYIKRNQIWFFLTLTSWVMRWTSAIGRTSAQDSTRCQNESRVALPLSRFSCFSISAQRSARWPLSVKNCRRFLSPTSARQPTRWTIFATPNLAVLTGPEIFSETPW